MAESIGLHFVDTTWESLSEFLNEIAVTDEARGGWVPKTETCVHLYEYDDVLNEYEAKDIDQLVEELGNLPSCTLCIELRRSEQERVYDVTKELTVLLLRRFTGVADDLHSAHWTLTEIEQDIQKANGGFLDCYRKKKVRVTRPHLEQLYKEALPILVDFEGTGLCLKGYDLSEIDLSKFDFQYANLEGTCFDHSNLRGAYFSEANLKNASFVDAELEGVDFRDAILDGANFTGANLKDADIRGASLQNAQITTQQRNSTKKTPITDLIVGYGVILTAISFCICVVLLVGLVFA